MQARTARAAGEALVTQTKDPSPYRLDWTAALKRVYGVDVLERLIAKRRTLPSAVHHRFASAAAEDSVSSRASRRRAR